MFMKNVHESTYVSKMKIIEPCDFVISEIPILTAASHTCTYVAM